MFKRLAIALSSLALPLMMAGVAHADTTTITNTGPGSVNQSTVNNSYVEVVTNTNTGFVTNTNVQTGTTGAANVSDNTTGGNATSGDVTNSYNASTAIAIANTGTAVATAGTTSAIAGGSGGGASVGVDGVSAATLPRTGGGGMSDLMRALMNARTGVFSSMPVTGVKWSWVPSVLALLSTVGLTYAYSKYKQNGLDFMPTTV